MLAVPMEILPAETTSGDVIGVLQLINAMDDDGEIIPFPEECERIVQALGSLAAVSLRNNQLSRTVYDLLNSFVRVMVDSIDTRSSYNANHTKSMARYAEAFLTWLEHADAPERIKRLTAEREPFLMSIWLHDIGKLVIPLSVMDKATRLGHLEEGFRHKLTVAHLMERLRAAEDPSVAEEAAKNRRLFDQAQALVDKANRTGVLDNETITALQNCAQISCLDAAGKRVPLLDPEELEAITVPRGTLTNKERTIMESHVTYTSKMLSEMRFAGIFSQVPAWAGAHHELLDGSGYPEGRRAASLPPEVRLMTILDIYDALTADDRPYKPPLPQDEAFEVLDEMARDGKIDAELLALFHESRAWQKTA